MVDSLILLYEKDAVKTRRIDLGVDISGKPMIIEDHNDFDTMGIRGLPDAISCYVERDVDGVWEGEMEYPSDGVGVSDIQLHRILYLKPSPTDHHQPMRIREISKAINGVITVYFRHVNYDLSDFTLLIMASQTQYSDVLINYINNNIAKSNRLVSKFYRSKENYYSLDLEWKSHVNYFYFIQDESIKVDGNNRTFPITSFFVEPTSFRYLMSDNDNSVLNLVGGEWKYDHFNVILVNRLGEDKRYFEISYGKNITDLTADFQDTAYTHVYPYFSYNGKVAQLDGGSNGTKTAAYDENDLDRVGVKINVDLTGDDEAKEEAFYDPTKWKEERFARMYPYDCTDILTDYYKRYHGLDLKTMSDSSFENLRDVDGRILVDLYKLTKTFIKANQAYLLSLETNITLSYVDDPDEIQRISHDVNIGDIVTVKYEPLGVKMLSRVIKTKYNVLTDIYDDIELSDGSRFEWYNTAYVN